MINFLFLNEHITITCGFSTTVVKQTFDAIAITAYSNYLNGSIFSKPTMSHRISQTPLHYNGTWAMESLELQHFHMLDFTKKRKKSISPLYRQLGEPPHRQVITVVHPRSPLCDYVTAWNEAVERGPNAALDLAVNLSLNRHLWTRPLGRYQENERKLYRSSWGEVTQC